MNSCEKLDCCRSYLIPAQKNFGYRLQHPFARIACNKTITVNIRADSSHLQNRRFRKVVLYGKANGLLHAGFHAIGDQDHVKDLCLAGLVNFFQAASGPYTIAGAFEPFQSQAQSGFGCHNQ